VPRFSNVPYVTNTAGLPFGNFLARRVQPRRWRIGLVHTIALTRRALPRKSRCGLMAAASGPAQQAIPPQPAIHECRVNSGERPTTLSFT